MIVSRPDQSELRTQVIAFSRGKAQAYSPSYAFVSARMADDPSLLYLLGHARSRPPVDLFFAAVQYVARRSRSRLAGFFDHGIGGWPSPDRLYRDFREFCLGNSQPIISVLTNRHVQTNEPARSGALLAGLALVAQRAGGRPIHLLELGASAGLLLIFDRYRYRFRRPDGTTTLIEGVASGLHRPAEFVIDLRGSAPQNLAMPAVAQRSGIDLNPVDLTDPDSARWLSSFVWPEEQERRERIEWAAGSAAVDPPRIVRGDAADLLTDEVDRFLDGLVCVFHSHAFKQFPEAAQQRLDQALTRYIEADRCVRLAFEGNWRGSPVPRERPLPSGTYAGLGITDRTGSQWVAVGSSRGKWIEYL